MHYDVFAEYILKRYTGKVVEVGVGFNFKVAKILSKKLKVIVTDIKSCTFNIRSSFDGLDYSKFSWLSSAQYDHSLINSTFKSSSVLENKKTSRIKKFVHGDIIYMVDDITNPRIEIYKNSSLIYSIRPPFEIQQDIIKVAKMVNADCIIRPLYGDEPVTGKLINYKGEFFYLIKK